MTNLFLHSFNLIRQAGPAKHIAVALSGGADSWALTLLAAEWCQEQGVNLTALTVDHALRPESAAEAQAITAECASRGIKHEILRWNHDGISTSLQERARAARYKLLADYCRAHAIPALLTAHHADDVAETLLLRLAKASDVGGLTGMAPVSQQHGITIIRPLLQASKSTLVKLVEQAGIKAIIDPSNSNPRFARARLRQAQAVLATEGLDTRNLLRFAEKMAAADSALHFAAQQLILQQAQWHACGAATLPLAVLQAAPTALQMRALQSLWRKVTGNQHHPLPYSQMARALQDITNSRSALKPITLGGMQISAVKHELLFTRELAACAAPVLIAPHQQACWDNRFMIYNNTAAPVRVGALGVFGHRRMATLGPAYRWLANVPAKARASLPALYDTSPKPEPLMLQSAAAKSLSAQFLPLNQSET